MTCPICNSAVRPIFTAHGYSVCACVACGHRCAEIAPTASHVNAVYDDAYFFGGGAGYSDYTSEAAILRAHGRRYASLLRRYLEPGYMLDVGAAAGFLLDGFVGSGWRAVGLEPNPRMVEVARAEGREVETGTLEELPSTLRQGDRFDLISMVQVLPHFYDVRRALEAASEITRAGGCWLIEAWNRNSLTARLLGKSWHEYSPPSVLHWFSTDGIEQLAGQFGFKRIAGGRPGKFISGGHARSLLQYKLRSRRMTRPLAPLTQLIPERAAIPYPAEDLVWMLLRKKS